MPGAVDAPRAAAQPIAGSLPRNPNSGDLRAIVDRVATMTPAQAVLCRCWLDALAEHQAATGAEIFDFCTGRQR